MDADGEIGFHSSIAVDSGGGVHIGYQDGSPDWNLKYAFKVEGLTRITCESPANASVLYSPPTFSWIPDGGTNNVFALDFSFSYPITGYWSTFENLRQLISGNNWTPSTTLWNRIPSGSYVYWRVRGADLNQSPLNIIYSDEVFWFYVP